MDNQVLIVGAGPTGLVLALFLAKQGIKARIIDKSGGPGEASRAMVVQARTLEFYRQIGIAEEVVSAGFKLKTIHLREGTKEVASFNLSDMGKGLSPFPYGLSYPQDDHERFLTEKLKAAGIEIEWNTALESFKEDGEKVRAQLSTQNGTQESEFSYVSGCDGAHSTVRETLGLGFPGGTYDQAFFVADVAGEGEVANNDLNMCLSSRGFCIVFPVRSSGHIRLIGIVPQQLKSKEHLGFEEIEPYAEAMVGAKVTQTFWSSIYHVHHRVAEHFRVGRAFLCGDAGHVHSPVGGQGMNTGIGDAVNLAWKLAQVLQKRADPIILDSYEQERLAYAHALVGTTDRAFEAIVGQGFEERLFRTLLIPHVAPVLLGFSGIRRAAFRMISQTLIHYHESALSSGRAGDVQGGDPLPWVESADNFAPLKSLDWQVHVYGASSSKLRDLTKSRGLALQELAWTEDAGHAGLEKDAMYLVRPDGHIALASKHQDVVQLTDFLDRFGIASSPVGYSANT